MRVTLDVENELVEQAVRYAAERDLNLDRLVEQCLAAVVSQGTLSSAAGRAPLVAAPGGSGAARGRRPQT